MIEQLVRLLLHCGMPRTDLDLLHGQGTAMHAVLMDAKPRSTLFTGSQRVAERLAIDLADRAVVSVADSQGDHGWWIGPEPRRPRPVSTR